MAVKDKHCRFCGRHYAEGDHDPCILNLPGVDFACCGHGKDTGYILFTNGVFVEIDTHRIGRMIDVANAPVPAVTPRAPDTEIFWKLSEKKMDKDDESLDGYCGADPAAAQKVFEKRYGPLYRAALRRPDDYNELSAQRQWQIDKELGILDWDGDPNK